MDFLYTETLYSFLQVSLLAASVAVYSLFSIMFALCLSY